MIMASVVRNSLEMAHLYTFLLFTITCFITTVSASKSDPVIKGTELVFAFMIHRHGDRTPVDSGLTKLLFGDIKSTKVNDYVVPFGYGQLTDAGKRTGYKTGQFIRRRYNDIIAPKYNKSEMYIRSTDSTRTQMTVLAAMSAVYPAGKDNWSDDVNWDPVPYTTVPAKYDYLEFFVNCPKYLSALARFDYAPNSRMDPYEDLLQKLTDIVGYNFTATPVLTFYVNDFFLSLNSLGYRLSDEIQELMPDISKAAATAYDIFAGDDNYISLESGPLLNEFFEFAKKVITGNKTQRVRIYSVHDFNVYSFEAITKVRPRQGAPKYGSLYSLELRRVVETGQYVVLPVYLADPNEGVETYLEVEGCGSLLCDFDKFYQLTSLNALDESTWRTKCGFSSRALVDTTIIDK